MNRQLRLWLAVTLILWPNSAWAHAHFKRSEPAARYRIIASSTVIGPSLSERPELPLTLISLTDPSGNQVALGAPERDPGDPLGVSVRVGTAIPPGQYTLEWRTDASDGHPTHGTFSFTVLPEAAQVKGLVSPPGTPSG